MNQDLKISIIQSDLFWQDAKKNLKQFDEQLELLEEETDLIVLPEMFNTGFVMSPLRIAEAMNGPTMQWMTRKAAERSCVVTGSLSISEEGRYYNRLIWMNPDGTYQYYNKRHLFRMGNEQQFFAPGQEKIVVEIKGWRICPLICYDIRFPVWSQNTFSDDEYGYDLLIYGHGVKHQGDSAVIDFKGKQISTLLPNIRGINTVSLKLSELISFRRNFQVGLDWDQFEIIR
jgi:omega-amidase